MAHVLITGANRGIGLELCRSYVEADHEVLAACRTTSPELDALGVRVLEGVDVASDIAIEGLANRLDGVELDLLINNAGVMTRETLDDLDLERIRRQFEVNTLGPLRVTRALLPNLSAGSKVGIVTSLMGSMADNGSGGAYGYRISKAGLNAAAVSLARDLDPRGIAVLIFHPGLVATEMTGGRGIPAAESAAGLARLLEQYGLEETGTFWHSDGRPLPW